jgi:hypothetical protein
MKKTITDAIVAEAQRRYRELGVSDDFSYRIKGPTIEFGTDNRVDWAMPHGFSAIKKECTKSFIDGWAKRYEPYLGDDPEEVYAQMIARSDAHEELANQVLATRRWDYVITNGVKIWSHIYSADNKWLRTGPHTLKTVLDKRVYRWSNLRAARISLPTVLENKHVNKEDGWGVVRIGRSSSASVACSRIEWSEECPQVGIGIGVATTVAGVKGP